VRRSHIATLLTVIGAMLMPFSFTLFVTAPIGITFADEPQDSVLFEDFECLNCHTDKIRLTELAEEVPQEEEAALSSGPG
jgi:hypothetical protein